MKVITAPERYTKQSGEITVFLAGGITNCPNWQEKVIENLKISDPSNLVIFNPRRDNFPIGNKDAAYEQIKWEFENLENADIFSMYFSSGVSDQPICMYELGRNLVRMKERFPTDYEKRVIISIEDEYKREQDVIIQTGLATDYLVELYKDFDKERLNIHHAASILEAYDRLSNTNL